MKAAHGSVFKYGDNVDTDVIIPARYLNSSDPKELATHCMEDIDKDSGVITDVTTGQKFQGQAFPPFMQKIIDCEGLVNYINQK